MNRSIWNRLAWTAPFGVFAWEAMRHGIPMWVVICAMGLHLLGYAEARFNPL